MRTSTLPGRTARLSALVLAGGLALTACGSDDPADDTGSGSTSEDTGSASGEDGGGEASGDLTVGAFNFGESRLLANMYALSLEQEGFTAEVTALGNREVVLPALVSGELDVVPEYAGTLTTFLYAQDNDGDAEGTPASGDTAETVEALRGLAESRGLEVLEPSPAQDANAFAVSQEFADEAGLETLSDLTDLGDPVVLGGPPECPVRPFCQPGLEETYGLEISEFRELDAGGPLTKEALSNGEIDLGLVFSSDGSLENFGLVVLEDDMNLQTVENIVPVVNADALTDAVREALAAVSEALDTETLTMLNTRVDVDGEDPAAVAEDFLTEAGVLQG